MANYSRPPCDLVTVVIVVLALCECSSVALISYSSQIAYTNFEHGYPNTNLKLANVRNNGDTVRQIPQLSTRGRRNLKENLCKEICKCKTINNYFLAVECNITRSQEYIFGAKNYIPEVAISFHVKLPAKARLTIEPNFFAGTKINGISIEGTVADNIIHIEFRPNASAGILGPNPEINIKNCHTLVLGENAFSGNVKFSFSKCEVVHIFENAFYSSKFNGLIENVDDLRINEGAFNKAEGSLSVSRSNIENLYRFNASLRQISFYNCKIGSITQKTFDVLEIHAILFENCEIDFINTNAITERLLSGHLKITGGSIGTIESQAIHGSGITELILLNNRIDTIQQNAILVSSVNVTIKNNRISHTGKNWMNVKEWTDVRISNNSFGEFDSMMIEKVKRDIVNCVFEKNLITEAKPNSLNFGDKRCSIRQLSFDHNCKCLTYENWLEKLSNRDLRSESYCTIDDTLKFCFNRTLINVLRYENEVCSNSSNTLDCLKQRDLEYIDGKFITRDELKPKVNRLLYIAIGIFLAIMVIVFIITSMICLARRRKQIAVRAQTYDEARPRSVSNQNLFSREDQRIIDQTLEIVRQNYPSGTYEELCRQVKDLTKPNISETELVQTIGAIVYILNSCENRGDNFVAFTAILGKLLQPADETNPDPVYAEPQQMGLRMYNIPGEQTEIEHIYNEPNNVQTPLLNNDYAIPADKNEAPPVYTEPVGNNADIIDPYSVSAKHAERLAFFNNHPLEQPGTSRNLPDVLSSSNSNQAKTNVQRIAENFANNPNFHITRSPTTNRRIPQYAIPIPSVRSTTHQPSLSKADTKLETGSNHSGGSDITVKIDDIDYADA